MRKNNWDRQMNRVIREHEAYLGKQQTRAYLDSGLVGAFRPAQRVKARGLIHRATVRVKALWSKVSAALTTEQGSAGAASPSTYEASLLAQRFDRIAIIQDCRQMVVDDIRARRASIKYAAEVARDGVTISVNFKSTPKRLGRNAEDLLGSVQRIVTPSKLFSWMWMLLVEGDLFVQAIEYGREVVNAKRMPSAGMERLTDDADEFIDPERAFAQVDVNTYEDVAHFPLALMFHQRWRWIDGERYGSPEMIAARRMRRVLDLVEEAKMVDRLTRAPQRKFWHIGSKEALGTPGQVEKFKGDNGFVEGSREIFDPQNVALDFFDNGAGSCEVLDGSRNVDRIEDIKYYQRVYGAGLPTPLTLIGLDLDEVNRDVMEDMRAEWLKETHTGRDAMVEVIRWLCDLQLMLNGILPESVSYDVRLSDSSIETPLQVTERVISQRNARLLPKRNAVQMLAEFNDIRDIEEALAEIAKEEDLQFNRDMERLSWNVKAESAPGNGKTNGNGKSKDMTVSQITGR